ncbi:hypothetical protein Tco_0437315, partial [Tanacetum coccineum]
NATYSASAEDIAVQFCFTKELYSSRSAFLSIKASGMISV